MVTNPGAYRFTSPEVATAMLAEARKLKSLGHAIVADEVYESDGRFVMTTVLHYLTCKECLRIKKETSRERKPDSASD